MVKGGGGGVDGEGGWGRGVLTFPIVNTMIKKQAMAQAVQMVAVHPLSTAFKVIRKFIW